MPFGAGCNDIERPATYQVTLHNFFWRATMLGKPCIHATLSKCVCNHESHVRHVAKANTPAALFTDETATRENPFNRVAIPLSEQTGRSRWVPMG